MTTREDKMRVWEDMTSELFPGIQVSSLQLAAHAMVQLKPKHVIQSPWMRAPLPPSIWDGFNWWGEPTFMRPPPPFDINNGFTYGSTDPSSWKLNESDFKTPRTATTLALLGANT